MAAVIDLFSRRVVGWSMKAEMTTALVTDALVMAIWRRGKPDALLHPSDRGSQYASQRFQEFSADNEVICSMNRSAMSGTCRDGELLLLAENGAHKGQNLSDARRSQDRYVRIHREVLQHDPQALDYRLSPARPSAKTKSN